MDKDPDMSTAEGWMKDALILADEVLEAGEGDLVGMGDFGDVEYMVCPLFCLLFVPPISCSFHSQTIHLSVHPIVFF